MLFEARDLTKRYPGVLANEHVSFAVRRGGIHAPLGENGACKSTLMKVVYGLAPPDGGSMSMPGQPYRSASMTRCRSAGRSTAVNPLGAPNARFLDMKKILDLVALALLGGTVFAPVFAQTPPDAGGLLRQQEELRRRAPSQLPPAKAEEERPPLQVGEGQKVRVKAIRFSGATGLVPEAALQALVADAIDRQLDFAALQQLAERVTAYLKGKGWFLARAYLPRQDVTEGVIEIALMAGRLSDKAPVQVTPGGKTPLRMDSARLQAMADRALPPGAPAQENALNRVVLLMNDLPAVEARARLEAGDQPDTTRIAITVVEGPLFNLNLVLDNHGSRSTGVAQLNASASLNSPLGLGEQFTLASTLTEGLKLNRLGASLPIGYDGWRLSANYSDMRYDVVSGAGAGTSSGESQTGSLGLTYPWLRSRTANVYLNLGYAHKALLDLSAGNTLNDKSVDVGSLSVNGDFLDIRGGGGLTNWSLGLSLGRLALSDSPTVAVNRQTDAAGYQTHGHFKKWTYALSRLQKLPGAFTLNASLSGQQAAKNLDSSEKFIAGGPYGVRAYPGSEGSADSGMLAQVELRYDWPQVFKLGLLQLQTFLDAAQVELHHDPRGIPIPTATGRNRYTLGGAGVGFSLSKNGSHVVRAAFAHKLGNNPGRTVDGKDADGRDDASRLWLSAMFMF